MKTEYRKIEAGQLRCSVCGPRPVEEFVAEFERDADYMTRVSEYFQRWAALPMTADEAAEGVERLRRLNRMRDQDAARAHAQKRPREPKGKNKVRMKIARVHATARVRAQKVSQPDPDPASADTQIIKLGGKVKAVELVLDAIKNGRLTTSRICAYTGLSGAECAACLNKLISSGAVLSSRGKHLIIPTLGPIDATRRLADADATRIFGLRRDDEPGGAA